MRVTRGRPVICGIRDIWSQGGGVAQTYMSGRRRLPSIQIRAVRYTLTDIGTFSKSASILVPTFLLIRPVSVNIN